mgnify:CR=1 FL=1
MIIYDSLYRLKKYCEKEQFMGWDPYDGLNSKLFHAIPFLDKIPFCRLVMIQAFKRNPFNLRRLALIPKQLDYFCKATAIFIKQCKKTINL